MAYDLVELGDTLRVHEWEFVLFPGLWRDLEDLDDLQWDQVLFERGNAKRVEQRPGVYAFCIKPSVGGNLCGSYLLYLGMTRRPLRTRYNEYLRDIANPKARPKIQRMLQKYAGVGCLYFCFAPLETGDPELVEVQLLRALMPPANDSLPAEVRAARSAFR